MPETAIWHSENVNVFRVFRQAHFLDMEGVRGSIPLAPTIFTLKLLRYFPFNESSPWYRRTSSSYSKAFAAVLRWSGE